MNLASHRGMNPTEPSPLASAAPPAAHCGNCRQPMQAILFAGHYGRTVEIDLCAPCHLVWFDSLESVRLTGSGALALLTAMAAAHAEPHHTLRNARCPRCDGGIKTVHNVSRWGRTVQLECQRRHGAYQTFAQFLAEKGLIRPLTAADRAALARRADGLTCLNCGAPLGAQDERCSHCDSLPGMIDVARLAAALDPDGATEQHAIHRTTARHASLHCTACGAPLPEGHALQCSHCGATLAAGSLKEAQRSVSVLAEALRAHERSPAPHVRERKLAALEGDLSRRREWARQMEAEARGAGVDSADDDRSFWGEWNDWRERPLQTAAAAALVLFVWFLFWS